MKNSILLLIVFFSFIGFGQNLEIKGRLVDSTQQKGLKNAVLYLVNVDDSTIVEHQITKEDGNFSIQEPYGNYQLFISHPSYTERDFYFIANEENHFFDLGEFALPDKSTVLEGITIFAYKDPVYYKGDTLIYTADSFATSENAVVEDLLKKLPGVEVDKDGKIKVQGKDVARVLVDGDEFFGSDPTMATKNLSAKSIENVKVYEKETEDMSAGDDKIQVIDLTLKDDAKKGYFGKASFANDFHRYYEGEGLFNYFTPQIKLSAYALATNTTKTSLAWQDANKFGIELSNQWTYDNETDSWEQNQDVVSSEGYPQMWKTGAFFQGQVSKKLKIGANYTYTNYRVNKGQTSYSQYFMEDTVYYNQVMDQSSMQHQKHELNLSVKWDIDSSQSLEIIPKFNHFETAEQSLTTQQYLSEERNIMRNGTTDKSYSQNGDNIKTKVTYIKNFVKKRRKLVLLDNFVYDQFAKKTDLFYEDELPALAITTNLIDQKKDEERAILSNLLIAKYTEPFGKNWSMEFSYENFNVKNDRHANSFNNNNGVYDDLDSLTSNRFNSLKFQNILGISGTYNTKKLTITFGTKARNILVDNENQFTNTSINQNISNLLPFTKFTYKFSTSSKLEWTNRTYSTLPTINQLQPVYNNESPNTIQIGNPNLIPNYAISSSLRYNNYLPLNSIWIYAGASTTYTKNAFAQNTSYDQLGRSISKYENIDMFNGVNIYAGGGFPIYKKALFITVGGQYNYNNNYSFINNALNKSTSSAPGGQLGFRLEMDSIRGEVSIGYQNNQIKNSFNSLAKQKNDIYRLSFEFTYRMPLKFIFETDFEYNAMRGLSAQYNTNYFLWNASIGKKFLKRDQLRIDFIANDILNQNKNISRFTSLNVITDIRKLIITRYFLFKVTYQFNSSKIKPASDDDHDY